MTRNDLTYAQPTCFICLGGLGELTGKAIKASLAGRFGCVPPFLRFVKMDYFNAGDPASAELIRRYGETSSYAFSESETVQLDVTPLKAIARLRDPGPRYEPLWAHCPKGLLLNTRSDQSAQQPAIGRGVALHQADQLAALLENIFNSLAPTGGVTQLMHRQGWTDERIGQRIRVVFVLGCEGGTGGGVLLLSALIAHSVATILQLSCEYELVVRDRK